MGAVWYYDLFALEVATGTMIVIDNHQSRQLSMSTGIGLKGEMGQARKFAKRLLQKLYQSQRTLCRFCRL